MPAQMQYYVLDLETTGLMPSRNEIIECSIIRCSDRVQMSRQIKANFPERASFDALRICGKSLDDLSYGIDRGELVEQVNHFLSLDGVPSSQRCVIGHNISFDRSFLHFLWKDYNINLPVEYWLDTKDLSKRKLKAQGAIKPSLKLGSCLEHFDIKKNAHAHTAKGDTRATYMLWKFLMDSKIDYLDLIKHVPHRAVAEPIDLSDVFEDDDNGEEELDG